MYNFSTTLKIAILGTTAKNAETIVGAPSYTSGLHMCNGAAAILKSKADHTNKVPRTIPLDNKLGESYTTVQIIANSPKLVVPVKP